MSARSYTEFVTYPFHQCGQSYPLVQRHPVLLVAQAGQLPLSYHLDHFYLYNTSAPVWDILAKDRCR